MCKHCTCKGKLSDQQLIDQIEEIRVNNNKHWMDLVRLAFDKAPIQARMLMKEIVQCDGEVRRLSTLLAGDTVAPG